MSNSRPTSKTDSYVLVVEPSSTLRQVYGACCTRRGLRVEHSEDVGTGLSVVNEEKPIAVIASLELPGLSGASLVAALKSCPYHRAIPIAIVTSRGDEDAGFGFGHYQPDQVIRKQSNMLASLEEFLVSLGLQSVEEEQEKESEPQQLRGRILLAEDALTAQEILGRILHVAGAEVFVCDNGAEAVDAAAQSEFDLILMDIEMPKLDGRGATAELREAGCQTPIVALTGHAPEQFDREAYSLGFDGVIHKPVTPDDLIRRCSEYLSKTHSLNPAP